MPWSWLGSAAQRGRGAERGQGGLVGGGRLGARVAERVGVGERRLSNGSEQARQRSTARLASGRRCIPAAPARGRVWSAGLATGAVCEWRYTQLRTTVPRCTQPLHPTVPHCFQPLHPTARGAPGCRG